MGTVFAGRYELLEPLAEGGMGSVWAVRDLKLGQVRAAKLLRQSDAGSVLRFVREQSMRIDHPHVVTPESWAADDDRVLFTMPLVRGGSVATLIGDHGPLPADWVATLLDQTLQALAAVHAAGIVHRDVKPANLLLEPTGSAPPHLLLTDFGVAVPLHQPRMTRASQVFASPGYAAEEQLLGADPDPRQDLYSVGVVGLEMLSGERPPDAGPAARRRTTDEPGLGPLVDLLEEACDRDPDRRPPDATTFRERLASLTLPLPTDLDRPCVFAHVDEQGRPVDPFATPPPPSAPSAPPAPPPPPPPPPPDLQSAAPPTPARVAVTTRRDRTVGVLLLVVAAVCLVAATALVLG